MGKKLRLWILSLAIAMFAVWLFYFLTVRQIYFLIVASSTPQVIELPKFKGRIVSSQHIRLGKFEITEEFDSISTWGADSILTYGRDQNSPYAIILKAFRLDSKKPNTFCYTQKIISLNKTWGEIQTVDHVAGFVGKEGNYLKVFPAFEFMGFVGILVGFGALFGFLWLAAAIHPNMKSYFTLKIIPPPQ